MLDTLRYYWKSSVSVVLAAAVTTAVLSGALVVGDSVRGSLRALTLDRLGAIDQVLLGEDFVRQRLAEELEGARDVTGVVPAVLLRGSAVAAESRRRAAQVDIVGVDDRFWSLYEGVEPGLLAAADQQSFPSLAINRGLAGELGVEVGDAVLLKLGRPSDVPRETLMGSTDPADLIETLRVQVSSVLDDRGPGRFSLAAHQSLPRVAYVPLGRLQRTLDQRDRVNALLISGVTSRDPLETAVRSVLELDDLSLETRIEDDGVVAIRSRRIMIRPALERSIDAFLAEHDARARLQRLDVSTYLANLTQPLEDGVTPIALGAGADDLDRDSASYLPYSTISALSTPVPRAIGSLRLIDGSPAPELETGQVLINEWAAADLDVDAGARVAVDYWEVGEREELIPRRRELEVAGVLALEDLAVDEQLAPRFPGVHDADDMASWEPTFPVDLGLIRDRDEQYWDLYGATPKLLVAEELGRELWSSRFGDLTEIRIASSAPGYDPAALTEELREHLARTVNLNSAGLELVSLKEEGLQSARGATDFGGLFLGFSLFLIVSAVLLVALFFRLGIERRVRELGTRLAIGEELRRVRRGLLLEGLLLAGIGGLIGTGLAVAYAASMIWALSTLWVSAIGTSVLELHVGATSLAIGYAASLLVVLLAIWLSVRRLARLSATSLLRGVIREVGGERKSSRRAGIVLVGSLLISALLFGASFALPPSEAAPLFFGLGVVLLIAGLAALAIWLGRPNADPAAGGPLGRTVAMAAANVGLSPGRSLLSAGLVAAATFVIVAVGAYGHDFEAEEHDRASGTGGFQLVAESDLPIHHDLESENGRFELGFSGEAEEMLAASEVVPFRLLPGDDVSCLNLYVPQKPRVLGVPARFRERGGFSFQQLAPEVAGVDEEVAERDPWSLLEADIGPEVVPAVGDFNSVMWILKSGLGKDVVIADEEGRPLRLRLVGLLRKSVFQSELLISEEAFKRHFPSRGGHQVFLVETPEEQQDAVAAALESELGDYGFDAVGAAARLQAFQAVENTYLATFQVLGGLGLLLGTFGLAVILLRNVLERTAELATLRAIGFRRSTLGWTVFAENALLLTVGVILGTAVALVAVWPHLSGGRALVPWAALAGTLLAVIVVGLSASALAVRRSLRVPLLPALRAE